MEQDLFNVRAYGNKFLLQEDLSIRISEAIASAGFLFEAISFSPSQQINPVDPRLYSKLEELEKQAVVHPNSIVRTLNKIKANKLRDELQVRQVETRKVIPPEVYKEFIVCFYDVWMEAKDQIKKGMWINQRSGKHQGTKAELVQLFNKSQDGHHEPSVALRLFNEFISSLAKSGIMDFTSKSLKTGHKFRGSI